MTDPTDTERITALLTELLAVARNIEHNTYRIAQAADE